MTNNNYCVTQSTVIGLCRSLIFAILLACVSAGCATGSNESGQGGRQAALTARKWTKARPMRLLLGRVHMMDSLGGLNELAVDQAIRRACDSIPEAQFITLNMRDSLAWINRDSTGKPTGISLAELGQKLNLDGVIVVSVSRFGGIVAMQFRIIDPARPNTAKDIYYDVSYGVIRFRDSAGTPLLGPALYDVIRKTLGKYFRVPHRPEAPVASEPLLITNILIPRDTSLGQVMRNRDKLATLAMLAVGDYAVLHFPELVTFDQAGRLQVFGLTSPGITHDYDEVNNLQRMALYNLGIDRYVTGIVQPAGDSIRLRVELRGIASRSADTLIDVEAQTFTKLTFQTSKVETDFVVSYINLSEKLFERESKRIRDEYERERIR